MKKYRPQNIIVLLVIFSLTVSCTSVSRPVDSADSKPQQVADENDRPAVSNSAALYEDCARPYQSSSIWNQPIDWSVARAHPDSKKFMEAFWQGTPWIGADSTKYAPPIYFVDNSTPPALVQLRKNRFRDAVDDMHIQYGEPASSIWIPIPVDAQPAPGTDGQLVVINMDTGEEWGINKGAKDFSGAWLADGAYRYHVNNSGIPPLGFGQRGAGIGNFSGIVRRCEVDRGYIGHAVTLAYDSPCASEVCLANGWPEVIPPFTKTDGRGDSKYDIPEGARIFIHPEISKVMIAEACSNVKGCMVWVEAMQKFGGFVVDNSDHPKTYPEGDATANWDETVWSSDMLRNIPADWYDVLDWNTVIISEP